MGRLKLLHRNAQVYSRCPAVPALTIPASCSSGPVPASILSSQNPRSYTTKATKTLKFCDPIKTYRRIYSLAQ